MKTMTGTGKKRKKPWNLRFAAWVMSCISCMFIPYAVHAQVDCMGATMQLQGYAQQVQVVAANQYRYLHGQLQYQLQLRCSACGHDLYCQQACQAQFAPYFAPYFGQLNQWYYYQMQQVGYWYNMINAQCARGRARPIQKPEIVADSRGEEYRNNVRLEQRLRDLESKVAQSDPDKVVEIVIPTESVEIDTPDMPTGFYSGSN